MIRAKLDSVIFRATAVLIALYGGSYLILSLFGRYEPGFIGLHGVKQYYWAPAGFVKDFRWDHRLKRFHYPLYMLDDGFWHTYRKAEDGLYPINKVAPEDIGKVYDAWSR